ncbi:SDR family NAD(P)-dependent oxidoreductase [Thalassobaculum sp.]|uniref:SDR family NAD(P)-dependent oxidoreductase n=1 Tax=Thalassobaculum sp. TaxID=2022740 RepID=UPI0032ED23BB
MTTADNPHAEALQRALKALDRMQARLEAVQAAAHEPVAIVGLGCRFPGADGPETFLDRLRAGYTTVGPVPGDRAAAFAGTDDVLRRGGFLDDVAGFDANVFGVADDEAVAMDPHQRLLLETAWTALEDAGGVGGSLAGSRTGVWLGLGAQNSDYAWWLLNDPARLDAHVIPGSFHSLMPGRLSYLLDLRGPSLVVDAACASGLVAVHLACQALRRRECDAAVAAAVNLILSPLVSQAVRRSGLLSPTGACRSFDDAADGFVRGEGAAALVLKRLSDAVADGDAVWAVIHGSAVGQDGHSNGLTAPSGPAQEAVLRAALADARLRPDQVGYVEAHATGTRLGDAIEAQAIGAVYGRDRPAPLLLGALKPNLGHLEAASGMAALVKAVLARRAGAIPPTRPVAQLNRDVDPVEAGLRLVAEPTPWPGAAPFAGVSAFGMSGTNAHLIVGPAPVPAAQAVPADKTRVLCLGAATDTALAALAGSLAAALRDDMLWADVCATLNLGRKPFARRCVIEAADSAAGRRRLAAFAAGRPVAPETPLGRAAAAGQAVDWLAEQGRPSRRLRLPTYPFEHRRFWPDGLDTVGGETAATLPEGFPHRIDWQSAPAAPERRPPEALLLFGDPGFAARLAQGLAGAGIRPVLAGDQGELDRNPGVPAAWLVADGDPAGHAGALAGLTSLVGALAAAPRPLWIVTEGGTGPAVLPAMALALGRAVAIEHADLHCRRVDLDPALADPGAALAAELRAGEGEELVRHGPGGREVPRVVPLSVRPARFAVRSDAAYLVTGGFGGVGRAVAGWLAGRGAGEVVLLGRTVRDLPEAADWRARGVRVRPVAGDVAEPAVLDVVLGDLERDGVPLAGVFHCAGVTADALLADVDRATLERALRAKTAGALALDRATCGRDLDCFVLFSSITALSGLVGTGAYAAANAGLTAVARRRRAAGLPALAVMWGTWAGSGMAAAADPALAAQWERHGIAPFEAATGLAALAALLAADATEAVAGTVDWSRLARWCVEEGSGASLYARVARLPVTQPKEEQGSPVSQGDLERIVRAAVAAVVERPVEDPSLDRPFSDLGLGSLAAVELRNRLSGQLGVPVPATLAFNHPSVAGVVRFLAGRIRLAPEPVPDAARVSSMTEAEAERRMASLLAELDTGRRN